MNNYPARTSSAELEETGTVLQVGDGVARIYGLSKVKAGELIEFQSGLKGLVLNIEEDNVGAVLFGDSTSVKEGHSVKRTRKIASLKTGEGIVGRVVNTLGEPIDGKGPVTGELHEMPLERKAPGVIYRQPVSEPLKTGIKSIELYDTYWQRPAGEAYHRRPSDRQNRHRHRHYSKPKRIL